MPHFADEVYLTLGGGLGDVFWLYLGGHNGWQYLESLKQQSPKTKIKVLSATHNPQTEELLKYNPHISEFREFGWSLDGNTIWNKEKGSAIHIDSIKRQLKKIENNIYLTQEDKELVDKISTNSYIFIHPFAGEWTRCGLKAEEYIPIIDCLLDKTELNIVVVGSSYTRQNRKKGFPQEEVFNYKRNRLYNLVGKTNARVCAALAKNQHSFIGSWSAYSCLAWVYNKPSTVIMPEQAYETFTTKKICPNGRWYGKKDIKVITTNKHIKAYDREININNIKDQILKYYEI